MVFQNSENVPFFVLYMTVKKLPPVIICITTLALDSAPGVQAKPDPEHLACVATDETRVFGWLAKLAATLE